MAIFISPENSWNVGQLPLPRVIDPISVGFEPGELVLTWDRYKIAYHYESKSYRLVDLIKDPKEILDLKSREPDIFEEMEKKLDAWRIKYRHWLEQYVYN